MTPSYAGCITPGTASESVDWINITSSASGSGIGAKEGFINLTYCLNNKNTRTARIKLIDGAGLESNEESIEVSIPEP